MGNGSKGGQPVKGVAEEANPLRSAKPRYASEALQRVAGIIKGYHDVC